MENKHRKGLLLLRQYLPEIYDSLDVKFSTFRQNEFDIKKSIEDGNILLWKSKYFTKDEENLYRYVVNLLRKKIEEITDPNEKVFNWIYDYHKSDEGEYLIEVMRKYSNFSPLIIININDEINESSPKKMIKYVKKKLREKEKELDHISEYFFSDVTKLLSEIYLNHSIHEPINKEHLTSAMLMIAVLFWKYAIKIMNLGVIDLRSTLLNKLWDDCLPYDEIMDLLSDDKLQII